MVALQKIRQLYDDQGRRLFGQGADNQTVFSQGLLHGAVHIWLWHKRAQRIEVLVQKRAASKPTWPNRLDVSCAGHVNLGELPVDTAAREAREEIDFPIVAGDLHFVGTFRSRLVTQNGFIENEIQFIYLCHVTRHTDFAIQMTEVDSLLWLPLDDFRSQCHGEAFVGRGELYYQLVTDAISRASNNP